MADADADRNRGRTDNRRIDIGDVNVRKALYDRDDAGADYGACAPAGNVRRAQRGAV